MSSHRVHRPLGSSYHPLGFMRAHQQRLLYRRACLILCSFGILLTVCNQSANSVWIKGQQVNFAQDAKMDSFKVNYLNDLFAGSFRRNASTQMHRSRRKRWLSFGPGGVVKVVLGVSFPIDLSNANRALTHLHNIQIQYKPPEVPLYWWSRSNSSTFPAHGRQHRSPPMAEDKRAFSLYNYLEHLLPGDCLQRWFCEMARIPLNRREDSHFAFSPAHSSSGQGLLMAILEAIFRPEHRNIPAKYIDASTIGGKNIDCHRTFPQCDPRLDFLHRFSKIY